VNDELDRSGRKLVEELARRLDGGMMCEPCLAAKVFGGDHHCTGQAGNRASQPCPCCGTVS
jgi:hypothetical protein